MQVMHDDDNNITICTALYQSSGFFIIMSPAEGLHFSALVLISTSHVLIVGIYIVHIRKVLYKQTNSLSVCSGQLLCKPLYSVPHPSG